MVDFTRTFAGMAVDATETRAIQLGRIAADTALSRIIVHQTSGDADSFDIIVTADPDVADPTQVAIDEDTVTNTHPDGGLLLDKTGPFPHPVDIDADDNLQLHIELTNNGGSQASDYKIVLVYQRRT